MRGHPIAFIARYIYKLNCACNVAINAVMPLDYAACHYDYDSDYSTASGRILILNCKLGLLILKSRSKFRQPRCAGGSNCGWSSSQSSCAGLAFSSSSAHSKGPGCGFLALPSSPSMCGLLRLKFKSSCRWVLELQHIHRPLV